MVTARDDEIPRRAEQSPSQVLPALPGTGVGHAGPGFGGGRRPADLQQFDGDAVRRADEGHAAVTRRAVDRHAAADEGIAGVVDVVHGIGEMPEIAAAGVRLGIPVVGEFNGSRLVARGGKEHVGVAALLVRTAADLPQAEHLEEGNAVLKRTDADHRVQIFGHGVSSGQEAACYTNPYSHGPPGGPTASCRRRLASTTFFVASSKVVGGGPSPTMTRIAGPAGQTF